MKSYSSVAKIKLPTLVYIKKTENGVQMNDKSAITKNKICDVIVQRDCQ